MSVIKITNFGGELPSVSPRALPATSARVARNLLATSNEFRPLAGDLFVATVPNDHPKTIRRFERKPDGTFNSDLTQGWGVSGDVVCMAKGQIDDDLTERTYYTLENGYAPPRVFDITGFDKLLGVPAPTVPTTSVTISNEYSMDEDTSARQRIPLDMFNAVKDALSEIRIGSVPTSTPSTTTSGWIDHASAVAAGLTVTQAPGDYAFLSPMSGGLMVLPDQTNFLLATEFGGSQVTYLGHSYWAICITMQGIGYALDGTLLARLKDIDVPDPNTIRPVGPDFDSTSQLFNNTDLAAIVSAVGAEYSQDNPALAPSIRALQTAKVALEQSIVNYHNQTALAAATTAFYAKSDVASEITAAIANFAASIHTGEQGILNPPSW